MTTTMMSTFEEVFAVAKAAGVKEQSPGQSDQDFLFEIAKVIGNPATCSDETWNGLSEDAHKWYDAAAKERGSYKPISSPNGFVSKCAIPIITPTATVIPIKAETSGRNQSSVPNVANRPKVKVDGVISAIRKTIILNPDWTTRRVHEYLITNGWPNLKLEVVAVNAGDIRKTVEMVKLLNKWKD